MTQITNIRQQVIRLPHDRCSKDVLIITNRSPTWKDWLKVASMYVEDHEILDSVTLGPGGVMLSFTRST